MKKHAFAILIFILIFKVGFTQWIDTTHLMVYYSEVWGWGEISDVDFISADTGMYAHTCYWSPSVGRGIYVDATDDFGRNWNRRFQVTEMSNDSYAIFPIREQNTFFHVYQYGPILIDKTSNNGLNWERTPLKREGYYRDFFAVDTSHFFLIYNWDSTFISKYINGAVHHNIDTFYVDKPNLMFFPNADTGYIAASSTQDLHNHFIYKSTTGGTNFVKIFTDSLMNINDMFFTSANMGYAVGDLGKIIKTTDGGSSWEYLNTNLSTNLKSLFFINDDLGYVAGSSGLIIKTINGGASWTPETVDFPASFTKIFFVNDTVGFALSNNILFRNQPPSNTWVIDSKKSHLQISPNPFSSQTVIHLSIPLKKATLTLFNSSGKMVKIRKNISGQAITLSRNNLPSGLYFFSLADGNESFKTGKVIITD